MKSYGVLLFGCVVVAVSNAQPPGGELVPVSTDRALLLAHEERPYTRGQFLADIRDHSIDIVIAGLYFAGSGIPGTSNEMQWGANVVASALWIADSCVRIVAKCRKKCATPKTKVSELREIVVSQ